MSKLYFSYRDIHTTVRALAGMIRASGFDPDVTVAIGSGGFIPARILKTYLGKPILTVGLVYYGEDHKPNESPKIIQWIDEVEKRLTGRKILLVDEVDDSRVTLGYCVRELLRHHPAEIGVAVLHNKKKAKSGSLPDEVKRYFAGAEIEDKWVCYPWDADDIVEHERIAASSAASRSDAKTAADDILT